MGVNTYMARLYAQKMPGQAEETAGTGTLLALGTWLIFAIFSIFCMRPYVLTSANTPEAIESAVIYGQIVCIGSIGAFLEGNWTKVHQSRGNVPSDGRPDRGALTNIVLDPILIFRTRSVPELESRCCLCDCSADRQLRSSHRLAGLADCRAHKMPLYIKQIYWFGYASIIMQALFTVYIVILNAILAGFSDSAVTVLGLYYKMQTFFFIPLMGLQTCIVPVLSFNYATKSYARCREIMRDSYGFFLCVYAGRCDLLRFLSSAAAPDFSKSSEVIAIGKNAFPIIGASFIPAVFSLMTPVFFQAIGNGKISLFFVRDAPDLLPDSDFLAAVAD